MFFLSANLFTLIILPLLNKRKSDFSLSIIWPSKMGAATATYPLSSTLNWAISALSKEQSFTFVASNTGKAPR